MGGGRVGGAQIVGKWLVCTLSRMNGRILTKLEHLYCCDMEKN